MRKTGNCISGPPWIDRTRIATPAAHSVAARLMRSASRKRPAQFDPARRRPACRRPARATVSTAQVTRARSERRQRVAGDDAPAVRGGEQVAAGEAALEVARDREAGEDAAEGRRLEEDEDVLEGGVAAGEVEAGNVARSPRGRRRRRRRRRGERSAPAAGSAGFVRKLWTLRQATAEATARKLRVRLAALTFAPAASAGRWSRPACRSTSDRARRCRSRARVPRASQPVEEQAAERLEQVRDRVDGGDLRNQSVWIRSRGSAIDERKRKTKKSGKRPCTASPEPVRSAAKRPIEPKPSVIETTSMTMTSAPGTAGCEVRRRRPGRRPGRSTACTRPSTTAPASRPLSSGRATQRGQRQAVEEAGLDVARRGRCRRSSPRRARPA